MPTASTDASVLKGRLAEQMIELPENERVEAKTSVLMEKVTHHRDEEEKHWFVRAP